MSETIERPYAPLTHIAGVAAMTSAIGNAVTRGLTMALAGAGTGEMEADTPATWDADEAETVEVHRSESGAASYAVALMIAAGLLSVWVGLQVL